MSGPTAIGPVVGLPTFREPVESVVKLLERLLEDAKRGELRGLVVAYEVHAEGTAHDYAWGDRSRPMALVGEMNLAMFSLHVASGRVRFPEGA